MTVDNIFLNEEIDVTVEISTIIIGGGESLTKLKSVDGYTFEKIHLNDFKYCDEILMSNGKINPKYFLSQLQEDKNNTNCSEFIMLKKKEIIKIARPEFKGIYFITDKDDDLLELEMYIDNQYQKITRIISKINLLNSNNIGIYEVFYECSYSFLLSTTKKKKIINSDVNTIVKQRFDFDVDNKEIYDSFLLSFNEAYELLNNAIQQYSYANRLLDSAVRFEKLITTLEMLFLPRGQKNKKETLSKRVAIFLGKNDVEINSIYDNMKLFYGYRSQSTHEGIADDINNLELETLNDWTRNSLLKYLEVINLELSNNSDISFEEVKTTLVQNLKAKVTTKISDGILPA